MDSNKNTLVEQADGPLTDSEQTAFSECESTIERGRKAFVEVGNALTAIRSRHLYRADTETIGEKLTRMIDRPPSPLPDVFITRLAVTAAAEPVALGRIFRNALLESRGGAHAR
jgi:hypothetical protein